MCFENIYMFYLCVLFVLCCCILLFLFGVLIKLSKHSCPLKHLSRIWRRRRTTAVPYNHVVANKKLLLATNLVYVFPERRFKQNGLRKHTFVICVFLCPLLFHLVFPFPLEIGCALRGCNAFSDERVPDLHFSL